MSPDQRLGLDSDQLERLATLFSALGDATRLRVVASLLDGEHDVGELCQMVEISPSAMSHQLAVLRRLRLVRRRREGRHMVYSLDDDHVAAIISKGVEHILH